MNATVRYEVGRFLAPHLRSFLEQERFSGRKIDWIESKFFFVSVFMIKGEASDVVRVSQTIDHWAEREGILDKLSPEQQQQTNKVKKNMNNLKSVWASKINWFLVLTTIADILALTEFKAVISPEIMVYIVLAQAVLGLIIRNFFTSQPTTRFAAERYQQ